MLHRYRLSRAAHTLMLTLALAGSAARAEETVDNPLYQSWAKFKVGTTVTREQHLTATPNLDSRTQITEKLVELTPDKAVLEVTTTGPVFQGQPDTSPPHQDVRTTELPARMKKFQPDPPATAPAAPQASPQGPQPSQMTTTFEDLTIGQKTYRCTVYQNIGQSKPGTRFVIKNWHCLDMPGLMVKMETTNSGGDGTDLRISLQVTAVDIK
jgi:hypothetical protein